ncbi:MAG: Mfa1 fimbrilin C-terminal domain-containing protein, partial [Bacteroides sp.]
NLAILVVYLNDLNKGKKIDENGDKEFLDEDGKLLTQYEGLLNVLNIGEITYADLKTHISETGVFSPVENGSLISKQEVKIKVNTDASFHAGNLKFYKDAKSYYPIYIKHFDYSEETNKDKLKTAYGYYGVVRNNVYDVKINSISKPGLAVVVPPALEGGQPEISDRPTEDLDKPTDPDNPNNPDNPVVKPEDPNKPDEPIIEDEFFISYDVEILPWFVRTQVEDL